MVCEFFEVPYDRLLQKTRKREIVQARQITMYLAKAFTKNSSKNYWRTFWWT
jgi:chromosomal replication initiator protein